MNNFKNHLEEVFRSPKQFDYFGHASRHPDNAIKYKFTPAIIGIFTVEDIRYCYYLSSKKSLGLMVERFVESREGLKWSYRAPARQTSRAGFIVYSNGLAFIEKLLYEHILNSGDRIEFEGATERQNQIYRKLMKYFQDDHRFKINMLTLSDFEVKIR